MVLSILLDMVWILKQSDMVWVLKERTTLGENQKACALH